MLNYLKKLLQGSSNVIVGVIIAGWLLDELGTKGRLGPTIQELANKVTRGYGQ